MLGFFRRDSFQYKAIKELSGHEKATARSARTHYEMREHPKTRQSSYKVSAVLSAGRSVRYIFADRKTGKPSLAIAMYEVHMFARGLSPNTRKAELRYLLSLYAWADQRKLNLDCRFLAGEGLEAAEIRTFTAWLRTRYEEKGRLPLEKRKTFNKIILGCQVACCWFIDQWNPSVGGSRDGVEEHIRRSDAQRRYWKNAKVKEPRVALAPDLKDEEISAIEQYLRPEGLQTGEANKNVVRDYLIWRLAIEFGLRIGEILALRLIDCPSFNRNYFSVVSIDERTSDSEDPRGAYAPRPKTRSRDLGVLHKDSQFPGLVNLYISECRYTSNPLSHKGRRFLLAHNYLIISRSGSPLSVATAQDIATRISKALHFKFHWHLARHAFFNRAYASVASIRDPLKKEVQLKDLVYWGGWSSQDSLGIYSERARRDRARYALKDWQEWSRVRDREAH